MSRAREISSSVYFRNQTPTLLDDTQTRLWLKKLRTLKHGGKAWLTLRNQIVEGNLQLSLTAARRFSGSALSFEDRIQVCNVALIKVIDTLDPDRFHTSIAPYCYRVMLCALIHAEAEQTHAVQLHHFSVWLLKHPVDDQPLTRTQRATLGAIKPALSTDAPASYQDTTISVGEMMRQHTYPSPDAGLDPLPPLMMDIAPLLASLNEIERQVLLLRFGLGEDGLEHTPAEIGILLDLTPQQAGRYAQIALKKLRRVPVAITTPHQEQWWQNRAS